MNARAYAKINLGLRILQKRGDGFHDIETVFHQINLYDELVFKLHERSILLKTNRSDLPTDAANLCVKAAQLLRDLTGTQDGVEIYLRKNIPLGAGLGGGSSDAATTLRYLRQLWKLEISDDELHSLALSLGSDVPFFIKGGTAYATGRGDVLTRLDISLPYWILVVTPALHVSTAWAYKNVNRLEPQSSVGLGDELAGAQDDPRLLSRMLVNDFEDVVFAEHPELKGLKVFLLDRGADAALMTGSGSSLYGLFRNESSARQVAGELASRALVSLTEPGFVPTTLPASPPAPTR